MTTDRLLFFLGILCCLSTLQVVQTSSVARSKRAILKVCYGELGCFSLGDGFSSLKRPIILLPQSPEIIGTTFRLYHRASAETGHLLEAGDSAKVTSAGFNSNKPLKFLIHGFTSNMEQPIFKAMRRNILAREDANVIAVDWSRGAKQLYSQSTQNTRVVGAEIARLIKFLKNSHGLDVSKVHIIGHSLGAHTAGYAGELITGPKVGRITGLDPAGPYFEGTPTNVRLDRDDADFVDVLHTNVQKLIALGFGIKAAIGHADIYFNDGELQPGCSKFVFDFNIIDSIKDVPCSHGKANEYFSSSILSSCMQAHKCEDYPTFKGGKCFSCSTPGSCIPVGMSTKKSDLAGNPAGTKYFLDTVATAPFCGNYYKISMVFHHDTYERTAELFVRLMNAAGSSSAELQLPYDDKIKVEPGITVRRLEMLDKSFGAITKVKFDWVRKDIIHWGSSKIKLSYIAITDVSKGTTTKFGCNKQVYAKTDYVFVPC